MARVIIACCTLLSIYGYMAASRGKPDRNTRDQREGTLAEETKELVTRIDGSREL